MRMNRCGHFYEAYIRSHAHQFPEGAIYRPKINKSLHNSYFPILHTMMRWKLKLLVDLHRIEHLVYLNYLVDAVIFPQRGTQYDKSQYQNSGLLRICLIKFLKRKTANKVDGLEVTVELIVYPLQVAVNICCMVSKTESGSCKSSATTKKAES